MGDAVSVPMAGMEPTIRVVAMPADTNPASEIFGGWIVSHMDLAAGSLTARTSESRCVTIAIDRLSFHQAVTVGDELSVYKRLRRIGRSSMHIQADAWCRRRSEDVYRKVAEGTFKAPRPGRPASRRECAP